MYHPHPNQHLHPHLPLHPNQHPRLHLHPALLAAQARPVVQGMVVEGPVMVDLVQADTSVITVHV